MALSPQTVIRGNPPSADHQIDPIELAQLFEEISDDARSFTTRGELVARIAASETLVEGAIYRAGDLLYKVVSGSTAIVDMPNLEPHGRWTFAHSGADQFGLLDCASQFLALLNAASGKVVHAEPDARYRLDRRIFPEVQNVVLQMNGATLDMSQIPNGVGDPGGISGIVFAGSEGDAIPITSVTTSLYGASKELVTVTTSEPHGYAVGDNDLMASEDLRDLGHTSNEKRGQMFTVREVISPTEFTIQEPLGAALVTTPFLRKINWKRDIRILGGVKLIGSGRRSSGAGLAGINFVYCLRPEIGPVQAVDVDYQVVSFDNCYAPVSGRMKLRFAAKGANDAVQYGLTLKNATTAGRFGFVFGIGGRHIIDWSRNSGYGVGRDCVFDGCLGIGQWGASFAMHGNAVDCTVDLVQSKNSAAALNIRAPGWKVHCVEATSCDKAVTLTDNPYGVDIEKLVTDKCGYAVDATDNEFIGAVEAGMINIGTIIARDTKYNVVRQHFDSLPVYKETDAAVIGGTTTTLIVGQFPVAWHNQAGAMTGSVLEIDTDGAGGRLAVVRIAGHSVVDGNNVLSYSATSAAPIAGQATYTLRTRVPDVITYGKIISHNSGSAVAAYFGNFLRLETGDIIASNDSYVDAKSLLISGTPDIFADEVRVGDISAQNMAGIAISEFTKHVEFKTPPTFATFGARGDGSAGANDMGRETEALQSAFETAQRTSLELKADPAATYAINDTLSGSGELRVDWGNAKVVMHANKRIIDWSADLYGPYDLGGDYTPGDLTVDLTGSPLPEAPKPGAIMKIVSDAVDPKNRDRGSGAQQYRTAEFFRVGVGSTTTNIVLRRPLRFTRGISPVSTAGDEAEVSAYTTALNARVVYADNDQRFEFSGGDFAFLDGQEANWRGPAINVCGFIDPVFERVRVSRAYGPGIRLGGTHGALVNHCRPEKLENNTSNRQFGYGVADTGWHTRVVGLQASEVRHPYTSSVNSEEINERNPEALISMGRVVGALVTDGNATGGDSAHWDTHHSTEGAVFRDNSSEGGRGTSAGMRGRDIEIVGHRSRDCQEGIEFFTEYNSGDTDDDLFTAGKTAADVTTGRAGRLDVECVEQPFHCGHAVVDLIDVGRFVSQDHCALYNNGGLLRIIGHQAFKAVAGGVSHSRTGCIQIEATNSRMAGAIPTAKTIIEGTLEIDASEASAGTIDALSIGAGAELIVRGRLMLKLPSGAGWKAGSGTIKTEHSGVIVVEVEGAADNSIFSAAVASGLNVLTADGSTIP